VYLSLEEIKRRIDKYKELNYTDIDITGGEPTLHPNLIEIVKYGVKKGFEVRMTSNGVKLADFNLISSLIKAGLKRIVFSIHHFDSKKAMLINGIDKPDLDKTLKGVENANKLGIDININITVIKQNYKALPQIISMLIPRFSNIHHFNFNFVDITGNVTRQGSTLSAKDIVPKYSEAEKYLVEAFKLLRKYNVSFRFERAPLCYAPGFEAYNSNANRAVGTEFHSTSFTEEEEPDIHDTDVPMVKSDFCKYCNLNDICYGVERNYARLYGTSELYPMFLNPNKVEYEIKSQNNHQEVIGALKLKKGSPIDYKKLFNTLGSIKSTLRTDQRVLINAFIPKEIGLRETKLSFLDSFLNFIKNEGYSLSQFTIISNNSNLSQIKKITNKYKIKSIKPTEYVNTSPYDPKIISSMKVPKEVFEAYGIINTIEINYKLDTAFNCLLNLVSENLREKISKLETIANYNALLDIYSIMKHKIKLNLGLLKTAPAFLFLSKDLSLHDYLTGKFTKKQSKIFNISRRRKLSPETDKEIKVIGISK
jgi:MoaA/NifB/PqqE/SkfB family radical SAM enzyme